ncbi:MAG: aldehyde dehydrogenase [Pseudomonadales bacterium]|nr:aldehyde dehydrogenase [Pseudomonadales bacterium]
MSAVIDVEKKVAEQSWAALAVNKQRAYFETGATKSYQFRMDQLHKLKQAIIKHAPDVETALKSDLGRPPLEAYIEVAAAMDEINHAIKHLKKWMKPRRVGTSMMAKPGKSRIQATPLGVTFLLVPYNYPFVLCMQPLIGAIAAGNTVVIKPSSLDPATADVIQKIVDDNFDPEYVSVYQGSTEITNALLEERFDHIFFTGSPRVGKIVMAAAAKHLTTVTLELGGKSPTIVHHDADLKVAARRIISGKFLNVGQTCIAPDHLLVHSSIKESFVNELKSTVKEFFGDNMINSLDVGRLVNDKHFERVKGLIDPSKVVIGGETEKSQKFIAPTIMDNVSFDDACMQEEIFGPLLPVLEYTDLTEVYAHVKKLPPHPLALYLFTGSTKVEDEVLDNTQFGGGCINNTLMHVGNANLPFGGVGNSGMGSYHGIKTFEVFSHLRGVLKTPTFFDIKFRYAPYKNKVKFLKMMVK